MTSFFRKLKLNFFSISFSVMVLSFFLLPCYIPFTSHGNNMFHIFLNGDEMGVVDEEELAGEYLRAARRRIAASSSEMLFIDAQMEVQGEEVFWGETTDEKVIIENMVQNLSSHEERSLERCYTVKLGGYTINLRSEEDVQELLRRVLQSYDPNRKYVVNLIPDATRQISVFTDEIISTTENEKKTEKQNNVLPLAGIEARLSDFFDAVTPSVGMEFEDYDLGLQYITFHQNVEAVETYMPANKIMTLEDAVADVTGNVATDTIHEVAIGDTLSSIALAYGLNMTELIEINPLLANENTMIRPGDRITVRVARPKLSVDYIMQEYYEEDYTAAPIYKNNDTWFTNRTEVIQEAITGHRKVIARVSYRDGSRLSSDIIKQETMVEAVPRIVERGTVVPPTYIWPVSGGYITSGFGPRRAPKRGASTYHNGYDLGVPTGTAVMASSGGKVTLAGWQGGYGYVIFIDHPDGRQTRYGHLSRLLVKAGQTVYQGQRIALSGNTGNSTGPHLHFEVRKNGVAVSPSTVLN